MINKRTTRSAVFALVCAFFTGLAVSAIAAPSTDIRYTVKKGDTLGAIATAHGVSVADIQKHNGISDPKKLQVGQVLSLPRPGAPKAYVVKKGDTLGAIAAKNGLSAADLSAYNDLANANRLKVGQTLLIPTTRSTVPSSPRPSLSSTMKRKLDSRSVRRGRWKKIVIHHSATATGSMKGMDEYHRNQRHMTNGLAYHFVIGNGRGMADGEIGVSRRWTGQLNGGHLYDETMNTYCLGICLVGNFDTSRPTKKQVESLEALSRYLMQRCGISKSNILTHTEINTRPTRCPGRNFSSRAMLDKL